VIHDHDDVTALAILRAVRRALPPEGTLLIAEPMFGTGDVEPIAGAYFGFYLLALGAGRARSPGELAALLQAAEFTDVAPVVTRRPMLVSMLAARASSVNSVNLY
jgi:demethylspheroidene O-methyltransferase